eukprot:scaffold83720_cov38-Prasinocladus_malaysianus.AAC.1
MAENEKVVFEGMADEKPGVQAGDVVFVLQLKQKHSVFQRKGRDLFCSKDISLRDALCGAAVTITHLDKRVLLIKTEPGEVIKPGEFRCIDNEGMPMKSNPFIKVSICLIGLLWLFCDLEHRFGDLTHATYPHDDRFAQGNLYVEFSVVFPTPKAMTPGAVEALRALLPAGDSMDEDMEDAEEHNMRTVDIEQELRRRKEEYQRNQAYDSDEDEGMGGQRVQCAQQ